MVRALQLATSKHGGNVQSLAVDTWGVDFALLGEADVMLSNPFHYRDGRTRDMMDEVFKVISRENMFSLTGVQLMPINSLYQLMAWQRKQPSILKQARMLLMVPDLFNFFFTDSKSSEFTIATSSQMYSPSAGTWCEALLGALGLPSGILPNINRPGTVLGGLSPAVEREIGGTPVMVISVGSHDTASAVAALPCEGNDYLFISSGTWSLVGVEVPQPVISEESKAFNFTNEGAVGGGFLLMKNVTGLWLIQECRRKWWRRGKGIEYEEMVALAEEADALKAFIDPDDPAFTDTADLPETIRSYCRKTGQYVPDTYGEIIRCILESLALKYRWVKDKIELILGGGCRWSICWVVG